MNKYTQYEEDGTTVCVCHEGNLSDEDKEVVDRFIKEVRENRKFINNK